MAEAAGACSGSSRGAPGEASSVPWGLGTPHPHQYLRTLSGPRRGHSLSQSSLLPSLDEDSESFSKSVLQEATSCGSRGAPKITSTQCWRCQSYHIHFIYSSR